MHFSLTGKFPFLFRYNRGSTKGVGFPKDYSLATFKKCLFSKLFSLLETKTQFSECPRVSIRQHWLIPMIEVRYSIIKSYAVWKWRFVYFCWTNTWTIFCIIVIPFCSIARWSIFWKKDCLQKQPPDVFWKKRCS